MQSRRNFIKKTAAASLAFAVNPLDLIAGELPDNPAATGKPIVLSTWNFGLKANEEAWTILGKGGKALDAVEKGVRLVELDPTERSVGYGGRPDRDGRVTL
ncbi:isoaspartyl peptidase/L-asparaginase, partial [Chryseobacterium luteum]